MRKILLFLVILTLGVISSACVNIFAVHELNETAVKLTQANDFETAIARLQSAVALDQNVYETRYNLAVAYTGINDCESALQNIEIAARLANDKIKLANTLYTKGVIYSCLADQLFYKKNEDGEKTQIQYNDEALLQAARGKYVEYLKTSNSNFEKYIETVPNAHDTADIKELIVRNNQLIEETYGE